MERSNQPTPDGTAGTPRGMTGGDPAVLAVLRTTRARLRRVLVVERVSQAVAFGFLALVAAVFLDRVLRLPSAVRIVELVALVAGGASWAWLRVLPALRFEPPLVEVALRLERGRADVRGMLAAGADLAESGSGRDPGTAVLAEDVIDRASRAVAGAAESRIDVRPMRRALLSAFAMSMLLVILGVLAPDTAWTALRRLATPFADVQWPARTMVEAAMPSKVHPRGTALALRARTVRGEPGEMRVEAEYRLLREGAGEWRTVLLSAQPDGGFERLVETDGDAIEVLFRTEDMETRPVTVRLVPPPAVETAGARITPPPYAAGSVDPRAVELGNGTDRRSTVSPPVLSGSSITLDLRMRGALAPPQAKDARDAWIERTVRIAGTEGERIVPTLEVDSKDDAHWILRWDASGRGVVELKPEGAEGIVPSERIAFEIPAVEDAPPVVAITEPTADESVTPEASPLVVAEARDDLRVTRVWLDVSVAPGNAEAKQASTKEGTPGPAGRVDSTISIAGIGAVAGDRVVCIARAIDAFERGGKARTPVSSTPRIFRVIAASELTEQVRSRLGQMREAAARLRDEQAGIADAARTAAERSAKDGADATASERAQLAGTEGRMADRVAAFERSLAELAGRLERNKTDGEGLNKTIEDAQRSAQTATKRAQESAAAMPDAQRARQAAEQAKESEGALADLEAALERDRATAEIARRIDRLAEKVDAARRDTRAAAEQSVGKQRAQVPEDVRKQMDRAAQTQREAAAEARALSEELGKRADEVERQEKPDPGAAESMREARREADERGLSRQLEQAAQQVEQNQMQAAQQSQQQAQQAVQAMQQAMRNQQKRRTEELQRKITDVVEALRALLGGIESHALPMQTLAVDDAPAVDTEAKGFLQLSRNASGVAEQAAGAGASLRRAATLVARGAGQLDEGAVSLRKAPVALDAARAALDGARTSVQEALTSAQQAQHEAERAAENKRREELRGVYQQILERQRSARAGTESIVPAPGKQLDRRAFIESRRVAAEQGAVTGLLTAAGQRSDVSGSELYAASNREMASASTLAAQDLSASSVSRRTVLVQKEVEAQLAAMLEALADPPEPDDPFAQAPGKAGNQQGQQGGGGQQDGPGRVPPMAELRLLRTMAQRVLDDTSAASELPDADRAAYLSRVAERQKRIMELGERWMKAMQEKSGQPPAGEEPSAQKPDGGGSAP